MHAKSKPSQARSLFVPGKNCWQVAHSERVSFLVDGHEYFQAFAQAAERARHSILILAWDFDSRMLLYRDDRDGAPISPPVSLGKFLNRLARRNPRLHIHVLIWDYPMIFGTEREFPPIYGLGWRPHRRVHIRYDNTHPISASHHQKIVVIDDEIAFCGGLDLTCRRWDTQEHRAREPRRHTNGTPYPPFHDAMMAVDAQAARALGDLTRERWRLATGERLPAPGAYKQRFARVAQAGARLQREMRSLGRRLGGHLNDGLHNRGRKPAVQTAAPSPWPKTVRIDLENIEVAISRTLPPGDKRPPVNEVEQLYLDMIGAAREYIYIENQYFTAHRLGEALIARLQETDPPEILIVLRLLSHGWLEALSMENLRTRLIRQLREADHAKRFHVYYPDAGGLLKEHCIDVHSKVMIVDNEYLRIGSANFANRSMGFDTECDLTIEARGEERIARGIAAFRGRLLAEHLGVEPEELGKTFEREGSVHGTIAALRRQGSTLKPGERTLRRLDAQPEISDTLAGIMKLADPEQPASMDRLEAEFSPSSIAQQPGPAWGKLAALALAIFALAAAWRWTPLSDFTTAERITDWARQFAAAPWAPILVLIAYTPAGLVMFPRPLITLFGVVAFGPWIGFTLAMGGILLATWVTYLIGRRLDRNTVRKLAGKQINHISEVLRQRGIIAMTALRLVPLAPFAIPGIVAGALHIRLWHLMAGTALGMFPGTLVTTVFGDMLETILRDPAQANYWLFGGILAVLMTGAFIVKRWLLNTKLHKHPSSH